MSAESVRAWLARHAPDLRIVEPGTSTATVAAAADALGVEPGRIAKTLAVRAGGETFLLVTRGDARLDNGKCKAELGARPRMLGAEETLELTGHPVGGVCPFGLARPLPVYLDRSLQAIRSLGKKAGVTLNPGTPESMLEPLRSQPEAGSHERIDLVVMRLADQLGFEAETDEQIEQLLTRALKTRRGVNQRVIKIDQHQLDTWSVLHY